MIMFMLWKKIKLYDKYRRIVDQFVFDLLNGNTLEADYIQRFKSAQKVLVKLLLAGVLGRL